jgi:hypothetical protein
VPAPSSQAQSRKKASGCAARKRASSRAPGHVVCPVRSWSVHAAVETRRRSVRCAGPSSPNVNAAFAYDLLTKKSPNSESPASSSELLIQRPEAREIWLHGGISLAPPYSSCAPRLSRPPTPARCLAPLRHACLVVRCAISAARGRCAAVSQHAPRPLRCFARARVRLCRLLLGGLPRRQAAA